MRAITILVLVVFCLAGCSRQSSTVSYAKQIQPIFDQRCLTCHSAESHRGKIILTSFETFSASRAVSGSGPLVVAGQPEQSRLYIVVASNQPHFRMPPDSAGFAPMPAAEVALVYRWITQGANNN